MDEQSTECTYGIFDVMKRHRSIPNDPLLFTPPLAPTNCHRHSFETGTMPKPHDADAAQVFEQPSLIWYGILTGFWMGPRSKVTTQ